MVTQHDKEKTNLDKLLEKAIKKRGSVDFFFPSTFPSTSGLLTERHLNASGPPPPPQGKQLPGAEEGDGGQDPNAAFRSQSKSKKK